ncbi:murein transglycosylase [Colletotrichum abscissum]|uniref:Murein transglycosylase n=1 Tax=Colletotrichum abscissum TaxID=1671311 RepID=A0A9P9XBY9_9PEZI|nr:murein transglycosylase [Colletotrichum abscissum]KAI3546968.1 murein transglycosylase [Colletotrichum abscissum]KAK1505639.1 murein transglycosylase [Colletotrichum abscissum]
MKATYFLGFVSAWRAAAQLTGAVGPTTSLSQKTTECNILNYGAVNDNSTDAADAIEKAFKTCVLPHAGSRLIVPDGQYLIKRTVVLSNGTNWAFQLDGLITLAYGGNWTVDRELILQGFAGVGPLNATINGEGDGQFLQNGITIINPVDFEFYSKNGKGAIQGQGYLYRNLANTFRPQLIRLISPINTAVHDLILVDSPKFHIVFDFVVNLEVYHLTIRGANLGSYDGVDVVGTNYWIHDIEVTNRDECVSVKSPSNHALVENLVCNQAGSGISIGSLNVSASIANIHARNISIIQGNNIAFIKTYPGGSGYVTNVTFENFRSKASLYGLDVNQYWQNTFEPDTGAVALSNLVFRNFSGSVADGAKRPPLYLIANDLTYATNVTVEEFSLWTESGTSVVNKISNIFGAGDNSYGTGNGIKSLAAKASPAPYTSTYTITASPTGWKAPPSPTWALPNTGYGTDVPIPVYTPAPLWKPEGDYDKHYWGSF